MINDDLFAMKEHLPADMMPQYKEKLISEWDILISELMFRAKERQFPQDCYEIVTAYLTPVEQPSQFEPNARLHAFLEVEPPLWSIVRREEHDSGPLYVPVLMVYFDTIFSDTGILYTFACEYHQHTQNGRFANHSKFIVLANLDDLTFIVQMICEIEKNYAEFQAGTLKLMS